MNRRLEVRPFIGYLLVVKDHRRRLVCANEVPEVFEFGKRNRNLSENPLGCCRPPNVLELVGDRLCRLIPFFPFVGIERRRVYRPVKFRYDPVTTSVLNPVRVDDVTQQFSELLSFQFTVVADRRQKDPSQPDNWVCRWRPRTHLSWSSGELRRR